MSTDSSPESDSEVYDPLADELHNVQLVIHVTRENIDALNAKFANLQEPPAMYLTGGFSIPSVLSQLLTADFSHFYFLYRIPGADVQAARAEGQGARANGAIECSATGR